VPKQGFCFGIARAQEIPNADRLLMRVKGKMRAQISEVFQSIQGEGQYAGARQIFVRFFGCNMHCVWCDTPRSIGDTPKVFEERTVGELMGQIKGLCGDSLIDEDPEGQIPDVLKQRTGMPLRAPGICPSGSSSKQAVSLTGGEPLLQKDFIKQLLPEFKKAELSAHLETNGTLYKELEEIIEGIDVVAMDMKLPSSTKERAYWAEHEAFLRVARRKEVFIKIVVSKETERKDVLQAMELTASVDPETLFIIQPNHADLRQGIMSKCMEYQQEGVRQLRHVRVIPQMHKFMQIR